MFTWKHNLKLTDSDHGVSFVICVRSSAYGTEARDSLWRVSLKDSFDRTGKLETWH